MAMKAVVDVANYPKDCQQHYYQDPGGFLIFTRACCAPFLKRNREPFQDIERIGIGFGDPSKGLMV